MKTIEKLIPFFGSDLITFPLHEEGDYSPCITIFKFCDKKTDFDFIPKLKNKLCDVETEIEAVKDTQIEFLGQVHDFKKTGYKATIRIYPKRFNCTISKMINDCVNVAVTVLKRYEKNK